MTKIEHNFSNYSAWHYRSKLLPAIYGRPEGAPTEEWRPRLLEELQLVRDERHRGLRERQRGGHLDGDCVAR